MTIEQTSVVDIANINSETGSVHLSITDYLEWDGEHLFLLQEKINCYLSFVETAKFSIRSLNSEARKYRSNLISKYEPTEEALYFLGHVKVILEQAGFGIAHDAGPDGYEFHGS